MRNRSVLLAVFAFLLSVAFVRGDAKPGDKTDVAMAVPPDNAIILFAGNDLTRWESLSGHKARWKILPNNVMQVVPGTGNIITRQHFAGHFKLHVEFWIPYMPKAHGQARGNSGVYLQGRYEVQVLDSYGLKSKNDDCGAIYEVSAPLVNACKAPEVWQSYDIEFWAPKCKDGKKVAPPRMTVHQNGVLIQKNVKIPVNNTRAGRGGDVCKPGPIMLQDHGSKVRYRNIWLVQLSP
jgi:hypothetical protein